MAISPLESKFIDIEYEGAVYHFRVPTPMDHIAISSKQKIVLMDCDPDSAAAGVSVSDMEPFTRALLRGIATLERLIVPKGTTATWLFSPDAKGLPVIDHNQFPSGSELVIIEVLSRFEVALDKFLDPGDHDGGPVGETPVEGEPNP